ncbi:TRAP transporter large permease subunit [Psychromarinibacter sp. C21-152]|uniref:TRAP transporter large permease subunit n=1 Tax=Psychromarinibacter sediminicola TaxID=3033385 RepID=A0AAE3NVX1_9RHOB|nr:TRAP transporter large permease subunit [Psychromarinibacter sediminicola]MDF0603001.1 TRAP transporter large permease subunit [Psychromarinibacter sediminicola]
MSGALLALLGALLLAGILSGAPVSFVLIGMPTLIAFFGAALGVFDLGFLAAFPSRAFGILTNSVFLSVPLFVLMGGLLERSDIAKRMMLTAGALFGDREGGMAYAVVIVGALLAASTGVIGATIFMLGMIAMPAMLSAGYSKSLASGVICASGSLGQIIPPSILLILLTDQISSAYQAGRRAAGEWAVEPVSVGDLFAGAFVPGLLLVLLYMVSIFVTSLRRPESCPPVVDRDAEGNKVRPDLREIFSSLVLPLLLIVIVLGSILGGVATATESAALGAAGALVMTAMDREGVPRWRLALMLSVLPAAIVLVIVKLVGGAQASPLAGGVGVVALVTLCLGTLSALVQELRRGGMWKVAVDTAGIVSMLTLIVLGATMLSLVFRGLHGEEMVETFLHGLPGGNMTAVLFVMAVVFVLGFVIEYVEIIFIVVPIAGPPLMAAGVDPVWFAILISLNLQISFLTPPFGYALFYFRRVAPPEVRTIDIYKGILPFILLQMVALAIVIMVPGLATWLPDAIYH